MCAFHVDLPCRQRASMGANPADGGRIAAVSAKIQTRFVAAVIRLMAISLDRPEQKENIALIAGTQKANRSYSINRAVLVMDQGSRKRKFVR
jgi:hypothetical protein